MFNEQLSIKLNKLSFKGLNLALAIYCFLTITTLHHSIHFLNSLPLENLTVLLVFGTGVIQLCFSNSEKQRDFILLILVTLPMILAPLVSSLANKEYLDIFFDAEYRTMTKMLLVSPWFVFVMKDHKSSLNFLKLFVILFTVLGYYFVYRYLILQEVREFDLRPLINIRHGDPNFLATFFVMMIPWSIYLCVHEFKKNQKIQLLISSFCTLSLIIFVFMTQSRMAILALAFALVFLAVSKWRRLSLKIKTAVSAGFVLSTLLTVFVAQSTLSRFGELADKSNIDRVSTLKNGLDVFFDHPVFGAGMHKGQTYYFKNTSYPDFQSLESPLDIHNAYLKGLADLGLFGFLAFLILFYYPIKKVFFGKVKDSSLYLQSSLLALIISLMAIGVTYKDLVILFLFVIGHFASSMKYEEPLC